MDPLYVLRDHVVNKKSIKEEGNDIVFQNAKFPKSTQTIFQNRNTKEYFTLEALYFAYKNADLAHRNYMAACGKAGVKIVSLADNKDLQAFLKGEIETSPSIDVSALATATSSAPAEASTSSVVPGLALPPSTAAEEPLAKRPRAEALSEIVLDETLAEEKKLNAERLAGSTAVPTTAFPTDTAPIEGMSADAIELIKLKRMKKKMATINVEDNLAKPVQKGNDFVKADAAITKKIMDREKQLSTRSTILNTNGKRNFTDIVTAVNKSAKKEESEAKAKLRDKNQQTTSQTYDRYNVKEDQNWWKDKLKTGLDDFEIDTRGTFADGGALGLDKSASASAKSASASARPTAKPSSSSSSSSSSKPTSLVKHSSKPSHSSAKPTSLPPSLSNSNSPAIIIVPSSLTSLLNMYNAQEFLQNGKYVNSMSKRESGTKATSAPVKHTPKIKGLPDTFQIIDNTTRMSPKDWNRVVAVFVLGQAWQFKDWQWSSPVELFSNVRGFYLRSDDIQAPPEVKSWNVKILTISKTKRHLDQTAALDFWNTLEEFLARKIKH